MELFEVETDFGVSTSRPDPLRPNIVRARAFIPIECGTMIIEKHLDIGFFRWVWTSPDETHTGYGWFIHSSVKLAKAGCIRYINAVTKGKFREILQ